MHLQTVGSPLLWGGFLVFVVVMLVLDFAVFHRKSREVRTREAALWVAFWVSLAVVFNVGVLVKFGAEAAEQFLTGYLVEYALSVDNLFVFLLLFSYFAVPPAVQHRVLFWGILGAIIMRAGFILAGAALLQSFHWLTYVFGAFLVITGARLLFAGDKPVEPANNPVLRLFRRYVPLVDGYRGDHFLVREGGRLLATPLLLVLVMVESTDLVFATDSIPAIFGVTTDPFIVYTSNIFAVLGLRSMFFLLARMMGKFRFLRHGLSVILAFIGVKMLIAGVYKIPTAASLGVVAGLLVVSVAASFLRPSSGAKA